MLSRSSKSGPASFVLELRETVSSLSPLNMIYASRVLGLKVCGTSTRPAYDFSMDFSSLHCHFPVECLTV